MNIEIMNNNLILSPDTDEESKFIHQLIGENYPKKFSIVFERKVELRIEK